MMEFEANPDYFRGQPRIERVVLKFAGWNPSGSAMPELLSGKVDAAVSWRQDIMSARRRRGLRVYQQPAIAGFGAFWWNARHPLFQDARVRRALTLAINRRELIQLRDLPEDTPVADFLFTKRQIERGDLPEPIPYDPALANRLLDEAGWSARDRDGWRERSGRPCRFTLLLGGDYAAVYVQDQLKRVGVRMDISHYDIGAIWERIKAGEFEAAQTFFGAGTDLKESLRGAGYQNPEFFRLLEATPATFDPEKRDQLYRQLSETFQANVPVTLLFPGAASMIASCRIRGLDNSPYRGDLTQCMDQLWLEGAA